MNTRDLGEGRWACARKPVGLCVTLDVFHKSDEPHWAKLAIRGS